MFDIKLIYAGNQLPKSWQIAVTMTYACCYNRARISTERYSLTMGVTTMGNRKSKTRV